MLAAMYRRTEMNKHIQRPETYNYIHIMYRLFPRLVVDNKNIIVVQHTFVICW